MAVERLDSPAVDPLYTLTSLERRITMTTTIKAPRAFMGISAKNLVVLAAAETSQEKLASMLTYAQEKHVLLAQEKPTRAKKWAGAIAKISQIVTSRASGIPAHAVTFTEARKPNPRKAAKPAKPAKTAKAGSIEARMSTLETQLGQLIVALSAKA